MVEIRSYEPSMEIFLADRFQNNIELSTAIYNIQISKTALYGSIKVSVRSFEVSLKDRYLSDS